MKCEDPSAAINTGVVQVMGYSDPAVKGTMIMLECSSPDMILTGSNRITCADSGLWEPKPTEIECRREHITKSLSFIS